MLKGERVTLRPPRAEDLEANLGWIHDPEVTRFLSFRYPLTEAEEEEWLRRPQGFGAVRFAIETEDGRHIGNCGLEAVDRESRFAVFGIMIGEKDCWSRGYGTDALRTLLRFGFETMNLHRVELEVLEFNARGIRSYEKCGFQVEARLRRHAYREGEYHDALVMGILRPEYDALARSWP